jgi:hypothetical protein
MDNLVGPIPVMVAVLNQGAIQPHVSEMVDRIIAEAFIKKEYEPTIVYSKVNGVEYNRHEITSKFLKSGCQYLLMVDDDNPCQKNPLDLLKEDKDVISFPTFMWKNETGKAPQLAYNIYQKIPEGWSTMTYREGGLMMHEVDRAGTGCILIKRSVLESIDLPFESIPGPKGLRLIGEDMVFCDKAHEKGFKIWTNWDYPCSHYKTIDLLAIAQMILSHANKVKQYDI